VLNVYNPGAQVDLHRDAQRVEPAAEIRDGARNDHQLASGGALRSAAASSAPLSDTKQERYHEWAPGSIGRASGASCVPFCRADLRDRPAKCGLLARLDGDDEWQPVFRKARFLKQRVDVDVLSRQ
jgi:hypothetical protein